MEITRLETSPVELRRLASKTQDGRVVRRLLGMAMLLEGRSRGDAATASGMDRQTLCAWVHRYNAEGVGGLAPRPIPGRPAALTAEQMAELKELAIEGPNVERDKVVRWRCADLRLVIANRYSVEVHERTVGKLLRRLGLTRLQPRPYHPKKDAAAQEAFKKNLPELVTAALPTSASGKPIELWFQMLWGKTPPGLTVQTGRRPQPDREPATMPCESTIHVAIELSVSSWLVATRLPGAEKSRLYRIEGGDSAALLALFAELRPHASTKLGGAADVACCFEAGRDGFWLHRLLTAHGIAAYVLDATSILVNRRARRAKTDRLDAEGMLRVLAAWLGGDRKVCSMVRVPTPDEEDAKRPHREREQLVQEKLRIENRIEALLFTQGIRGRPSLRSWEREVAELRTGDGRALPPLLRTELDRLRRRLVLILELIRELEAERTEALAAAADDAMVRKITALQRIRGIGANFSAVLVREVLYRSFANRRQLASYVGIVPMPYQSGGMDRDRSISRAGNPRARTTLIQLAWLWLRYQPGSALAAWFRERVGTLEGRTRRIAIVAMARQLLIALWRYVETGVLPEGVEIRAEAVLTA